MIVISRYGYADFLPDSKILDLGRCGGMESRGSISCCVIKNSKINCLDLRYNSLAHFEIENSTALRRVNLGYNFLSSFDLQGYSRIRYLELSGNKLTSFKMTSLESLRVLNLSDNLLSSFELDDVPNLGVLDLSHNRLESFKIGKANRLYFLDLSFNPLEHVNLDANNVPRLKRLGLVWTNVEDVDVAPEFAKKVIRDAQKRKYSERRVRPVLEEVRTSSDSEDPDAQEICVE